MLMKSKVALIRCGSYNCIEVREALQRGIDLLGGVNKFAAPGERLLLKVNLLAGDSPDKCVTTHPSVFKAAAGIFLSTSAEIKYGDSPGFGSPAAAARKAGISAAAGELKIEMADFKEGKEIFHAPGIQNKKFFIANGILEADGVISISKFKTHGLERFTGAIKNQFGCVVGMRKGEFHVKLPDAYDFGKMLVDLNNYINPRLYIMDGIIAMEGNGPRGGKPKAMNLLLISEDPVALDATACRLINLEPAYVPTTLFGHKAGSGTYLENEIELAGDKFESFIKHDFDVNRRPIKSVKNRTLSSFLNQRFVARPFILDDKCNQCGTCVNSCPVEGKAVNWSVAGKSVPPVFDYDKCIRCYCCQEMCPESAVVLREPVLRKMMGKFF